MAPFLTLGLCDVLVVTAAAVDDVTPKLFTQSLAAIEKDDEEYRRRWWCVWWWWLVVDGHQPVVVVERLVA